MKGNKVIVGENFMSVFLTVLLSLLLCAGSAAKSVYLTDLTLRSYDYSLFARRYKGLLELEEHYLIGSNEVNAEDMKNFIQELKRFIDEFSRLPYYLIDKDGNSIKMITYHSYLLQMQEKYIGLTATNQLNKY